MRIFSLATAGSTVEPWNCAFSFFLNKKSMCRFLSFYLTASTFFSSACSSGVVPTVPNLVVPGCCCPLPPKTSIISTLLLKHEDITYLLFPPLSLLSFPSSSAVAPWPLPPLTAEPAPYPDPTRCCSRSGRCWSVLRGQKHTIYREMLFKFLNNIIFPPTP